MNIEELTLAAADFWNAYARAQNEQARKLVLAGSNRYEAAFAAYIAARAIVAVFAPTLDPLVNPEAETAIASLVKLLAGEGKLGVKPAKPEVLA